MMAWLRRGGWAAHLRGPAMRERLATLRILVGAYALVWTIAWCGGILDLAALPREHWHATGVARLLGGPLPTPLVIALLVATIALLIAFTVGFRFRVTAPLAAAALLWTLTYRNAWGQVFHTENLLVLHVIALALTPAADAYAVDPRRERDASSAAEGQRGGSDYAWGVQLLAAITAATYVLAGVAKLRLAGFHWLDGELLRNQIAIDNLRKAVLGSPIAILATPLLDHPASFSLVAVLTLVVELGAPLVFLGRRVACAWSLAAWGFHVGVVLMMNIWFPYPLFGFAYLPLLPVERLGPWARRRSSLLRSKLRS